MVSLLGVMVVMITLLKTEDRRLVVDIQSSGYAKVANTLFNNVMTLHESTFVAALEGVLIKVIDRRIAELASHLSLSQGVRLQKNVLRAVAHCVVGGGEFWRGRYCGEPSTCMRIAGGVDDGFVCI